MSTRDAVRFEANERVDVPDMRQLQRGARAETRSAMRALLFGGATGRVLGGFQVTASGPPDTIVTIARGTAIVGHEDPDTGDVEWGVALGALDGETSLSVDFNGKANGAYGIWVRFETEPATAGTRVFWNAATEAEEARAMDTRYAAGWSAEISALSPGTEWFQVASVAWGGATVVTGNITHTRSMFFEGNETGGFAALWGDGGNDRNVDRGQYGVDDLFTWVQAMRRQIEEIVGDSQKWYENFTRISASKFQIEGLATTHQWDLDTFFFAPTSGNSSFLLRANGAGLGGLVGGNGAPLSIGVEDGSIMLVTSVDGGDITFDLDDAASLAVVIAAGGAFTVATDNFDLSAGGIVDAVSYSYQANVRIIEDVDFATKLFPIYDGGLDAGFAMHDNGLSSLIVSNAVGIAGDLEPILVVAMDAANWFFQMSIDDHVRELVNLHSVAITWWAPVGNTCEVDVLLKAVGRTGGTTSFSTLETQTETFTGTGARQTTEFIFDQVLTRANLNAMRVQEGGAGTTVNLEIIAIEFTFDCTSVEDGIGSL